MPTQDTGVDTDRRLLCLSDVDNVCVATVMLQPGDSVLVRGERIVVGARIPIGHKIAVEPIAAGEHVIKYSLSIGSATRSIAPGEHVHTHNLRSDYFPGSTAETDPPAAATTGGRA